MQEHWKVLRWVAITFEQIFLEVIIELALKQGMMESSQESPRQSINIDIINIFHVSSLR